MTPNPFEEEAARVLGAGAAEPAGGLAVGDRSPADQQAPVIESEDLPGRPRRAWPWVVVTILIVALAATAWVIVSHRSAATGTPPRLGAGRRRLVRGRGDRGAPGCRLRVPDSRQAALGRCAGGRCPAPGRRGRLQAPRGRNGRHMGLLWDRPGGGAGRGRSDPGRSGREDQEGRAGGRGEARSRFGRRGRHGLASEPGGRRESRRGNDRGHRRRGRDRHREGASSHRPDPGDGGGVAQGHGSRRRHREDRFGPTWGHRGPPGSGGRERSAVRHRREDLRERFPGGEDRHRAGGRGARPHRSAGEGHPGEVPPQGQGHRSGDARAQARTLHLPGPRGRSGGQDQQYGEHNHRAQAARAPRPPRRRAPPGTTRQTGAS